MTDELVVVLEGEMEFEITGQVCHPVIGEELLMALDPCGCRAFRPEHRDDYRPLALRLQAMRLCRITPSYFSNS